MEKNKSGQMDFIYLLIIVGLIASYVLLRYGELWAVGGDSSRFTFSIHAMLSERGLVPGKNIYPNGYGYQTIAVFLINVTGITLRTLQLYGATLLAMWMVFPAWFLYRELTGTREGGMLATIILFVQPELLFGILRGTHEKFTRGLMLLALYLLVRSLQSRNSPARFTSFVLAFYITSYALVSFNNLHTTSFTWAMGLSILLTWVVMRAKWASFELTKPAIRRLAFASVILLGFAFLFTFYVYEPAKRNLLFVQSTGNQVANLFLEIEKERSNPYSVVTTGWINVPTYFTVSLANWLLLVGSMLSWLFQTIGLLLRRWRPKTKGELLLWVLYGGFALISGLSIAIDVSGEAGGNIQHRIFPTFAMLGAPMIAKSLVELLPRQGTRRRFAVTTLGVSLALLAVLSIFKATNDPLLSNRWQFYELSEIRALDWAQDTLTDRAIWSGFDERLFSAFTIHHGASISQVTIDKFEVNPNTQDFLISDVIRRRSVRLSAPLPIEADSFITYDNGPVQIYHWRPHTIYQE